MASVYDEYERSLTGGWRQSLSPVGWAIVAFLGLFVLGGIAVTAVAVFAFNRAQETIVEVVESADDPVVIRLHELREQRHELRNLRHELRHQLPREIRTSKVEAEIEKAVMAARAAGVVEANRIAQDVMRDLQDEFEGSFTFVLDGETLEFDMAGNEDGALFTLDANGQTYSLRIEDVGEGARLTLTTPEGESLFEAGDIAQPAPSWVPDYPGSAHPEAVFSGTLAGANGGAELAVTHDSPFEVVERLTESLESGGFSVRIERLSLGQSDVQGSLIGTRASDGKTVAIVVLEEHGQTKILTLWSDKAII